nr:MAG TPA: hypothetical protein [Caudoviricetes sp.]
MLIKFSIFFNTFFSYDRAFLHFNSVSEKLCLNSSYNRTCYFINHRW